MTWPLTGCTGTARPTLRARSGLQTPAAGPGPAPGLPLGPSLALPMPAAQGAARHATQQRLAPTEVVRLDPLGGQAAGRLPAQLALQVGPLGLGARHAQDARGAVFDVQADLV